MIALALLPLLAEPISATDLRIVTVGRFDRSDPASLACQWPASELRLRVKGNTLIAAIEEQGNDRWQVVVDGRPTVVLAPTPGIGGYTISLGADAVHDVSLVKRTEASVGTTRFWGFDVPNGGLFQARPRPKLIEFVGDSITAGYGAEGPNENAHFLPETENAYLTYASVAARDLDADVRVLAWSGRKMWPDNTMPDIYDRVLPTQAAPLADPNERVPGAVVINLATNDYQPNNPDEAKWSGAYEAFIRRVWGKYPAAHVFVTLGSMMTDEWPPNHKALTTARGVLTRMVARMKDPRLHFVEFEKQRTEDGIGSDWHPNVVTHRKMADRLVQAMKREMGW